MDAGSRKPLAAHLAVDYPFRAVADPDGGYVILFPDLPGCMTQVDTIEEIGPAAREIKELWIETEYESGHDIPDPSFPPEYSGKFNVRLPKPLHRALAESAEAEGVSLNQYVLTLLADGDRRTRTQAPQEAAPGPSASRQRRTAIA
jgi:predicted RNase H-like HicB family nuclease